MTTTVQRSATTNTNGNPRPPATEAPLRRRNRTRIAVGALIMAVSIVGVVAAVSRSTQTIEVLVVARDVPAGVQISADDLTTTELAVTSELRSVPLSELDAIINQTARIPLSAGALLTPSQTSDGPSVPEGSALVGAVLDAGQFPVMLRPGDEVALIALPAASAGSDSTPEQLGVGVVRETVEPVSGTAALVVTLVVAESFSAQAAAAGASGQLALVVVSQP